MKWRYKPRCHRQCTCTVAAVVEETANHVKIDQEDERLAEMISCWSHLPSELLREVFMRIENSEFKWPRRKNVVACAGVCKSWRYVMMELVKTPQVSGILTFPISLKQPGPRNSLLYCFIKRNPTTKTYHLYLSLTQALADDGKFLLAARKFRRPTCTDYVISLHADEISKGSGNCIGRLRSNFVGTKFIVYDDFLPQVGAKMEKSHSPRFVGSKEINSKVPIGNYEVAHISYELNVLGAWGPRKMHCLMDVIPAYAIKPGGVVPAQNEPKSNHLEKFQSGLLESQRNGPLVLRNKAPRWHVQRKCWCLNFHGRVTVASVKNFQLVASPENGATLPVHEKAILQFGKVGTDVFTMDYCYPLSAFQAFAICLSSLDTKIACE